MKPGRDSRQLLRLLFWESTTVCNLACAHCRRLETENSCDRDLSTEQAGELLDQLAELGRRQDFMPVVVFSGGEPLMRGDIFEVIGRAKANGLTCALATNGTLIDAAMAGRIRQSGISRVSISLDGADAATHDRARNSAGAFEKAIAGTAKLRTEGVPFQVNVTITRNNCCQLSDVYKLSASIGAEAVHIFMLVPVGCGGLLPESQMLSSSEYEEKLREVCELERRGQLQVKVTCAPHYQRIVRQQGVPIAGSAGGGPGGCLAGIGVLFVSHAGDVFPCGYLPVKCGNILEQSLAAIWYGSKDLAAMRDREKLQGKCGICGYRQVCGGCRARAYAATGNYMAEEPFCQFVPRPSDV